ncbi:MAG TPA: TPM domain-containing protein [Pyrinomonadaceae bacterium]|nr:TPM domain-containing protein [Pyrinomonadaceae bacterium]
MKSPLLNFRAAVFALMSALMAVALTAHSRAQDQRLPKRAGHVNDFAEVLDEATKERLEKVLENLQAKAHFDFVVATIKSAGSEDLYDYSLSVANDWKIGAPAATDRSLLIVVAADNGKFFSQVTRGARTYLPEGLVGEMGQRIREKITTGDFNVALVTGIRVFVDRLGEVHNFDFASLDPQRGETVAQTQRPRTVTSPITEPSENPQPTTTATSTPEISAAATPTVTPSPAVATEPTPSVTPTVEATPTAESSVTATPTPQPTETPSPRETPTPAEIAQPSPVASLSPNQPAVENSPAPAKTPSPSRKASASPANPDDEREQVELTLTLPAEKRIDALKNFIAAHPASVALTRANEYLVVAHAMFAEQRLQAGDIDTALQQFHLALTDAPADMPDRLFTEVIARIPLSLFLRGQRDAAFDFARQIDPLAKSNAARLVALTEFYLAIENAAEASRLAESAVQLAPDLAAAHQALGAARHIDLRLDDAASEYAKALSLDPKSASARIALADLKRAGGKFDDALTLYRDQLKAEPKSNAARAGLIVSLLELGKKDEAETELTNALQDKDQSRNLPLLVGAAYWFLAHGDVDRGSDLVQHAIAIEPRYSWAEIALARALVANKRPSIAEQGLRFARQYSRFPTLDYELATVLASMGLYDEALQELGRSFSLKDGDIQTKLAGRIAAHAPSFTELLAPERRAAIFQPAGADSEANARMMKALMVFNSALDQTSPEEDKLIALSQDFIKGDDAMRTYRQIYVAGKFVKKGVALSNVVELMDQATTGVNAALNVPAATIAVQAEELADSRARAIARGGSLEVPDAPRTALSALLRGRIEDLAGLALFNLGKSDEAVVRLRRAATTATEGTPLWRSSLWHLGAALEASGKNDQALLYYIKSYVGGPPDPARRSIIENVYKKVNGTLDGLNDKIGPGFNAASNSSSPTPSP